MSKAIIVEGKTDRDTLMKVLDEPVDIICTYGTSNQTKLEALIDEAKYDEIYVLLDADDSGNKLRRNIKNLFPNFKHLYTRRMYREVATTPLEEITGILKNAYFKVKEK